MSGNSTDKLPEDRQCVDCRNYKGCYYLFQCKPYNVVCDWTPSRFIDSLGVRQPLVVDWITITDDTASWPVDNCIFPYSGGRDVYYFNSNDGVDKISIREIIRRINTSMLLPSDAPHKWAEIPLPLPPEG